MKNFVGSHHAVVDTQAVNAINTMPRDQLGETLLTGVQRATEINHQMINAAANVQELAKIDISSVNNARNRLFQDEQLNQIQLDLASLNMKFNPVNSLLAGPQLGNRTFLRTQAILHNGANQSYSRSIKRKTYNRQNRFHSKQVSISDLPGIVVDNETTHLETEGDESNKMAPVTEEFQGNLLKSMQNGLGEIDHEVRSDLTRLSVRIARQRETENKDHDPVNMLQQVFRKPRKERKVGVNFLMEKYKRMEKNRTRQSRVIAKSLDGRYMSNLSCPQETDDKFSTRYTADAQTTSYQDAGYRTSNQAFSFESQMQRRREIQQYEHPMSAPYNITRQKDFIDKARMTNNNTVDPEKLSQAGRSVVSQSLQYQFLQQKEIGVKSTLNRINCQNMALPTPGATTLHPSSKNSQNNFVANEDFDEVVIQPIKTIDIEKSQPPTVHTRLMGIKRLLEEKDGTNQSKRSSIDDGRYKLDQATSQLESWGLETHNQMYADNISRRKKQLEQFCQIEIPYKSKDYGENRSRSPRCKTRETDFKTSEYNFDDQTITLPDLNEKLSDRDLQEYLTQRILQLKMATFGANIDSINDKKRFKFKASTLYNVQPANERKRYVKLLTGEIDHFMDMLPESQETIDPLFINQSQEQKSVEQLLPEIKPFECQQLSAQESKDPSIQSKFENESVFAFISKIQDPEITKHFTAKERNIGLHLQQALMKLDHKFDKKEKERNKAVRASQTCDTLKQSCKHNKMVKKGILQKVKVVDKIDSKQKSLDVLSGDNDEPQSQIEKQLIEALSEAAADDQALEKEAQETSKQPSTINMEAVRKIYNAEKSPVRDIHTPISNNTSVVPTGNQDLRKLLNYEEHHPKPQTTKIGIRPTQKNEKTCIGKKNPVHIINDAHVFNQYESGDTIDLKPDLQIKSEVVSKNGHEKLINYQQNATEPDIVEVQGATIDDGNDPLSQGSPDVEETSKMPCTDFGLKTLPDTQRAQNVFTERSKDSLQAPLKIENGSIKMSICKKIDGQTSAKSNDNEDLFGSKIIYQSTPDTIYVDKGSPGKYVSSNVAVATQFQPKRFNRHPRFSVQVKKGQEKHAKKGDTSKNFQENTVNLSPEFLTILMENKEAYPPENKKKSPSPVTVKKADQFMSQLDEAMNRAYIEISQDGEQPAKEDAFDKFNKDLSTTPPTSRVPADIQNWNKHMKQNDFDPFEKVVLVKGIDNQILTSYRTLKGQNNTVSDTYKIVHRKFQPDRMTSQRFYQQMKQQQIKNMPYIVENETESMEDFPNPMDFLDVEQLQEFVQSPNPTKKQCKHRKRHSQIDSYRLQSEVESNEKVTDNVKVESPLKIVQMPVTQGTQSNEEEVVTQRQMKYSQTLGDAKKKTVSTLISQQFPPKPKLCGEDKSRVGSDSQVTSQEPPKENIYKHQSQVIEKGQEYSSQRVETMHSKSARHSISSKKDKANQDSYRHQQTQFKHVYVSHVPNPTATQQIENNPAYRSLSPVILPMNADFTQAGVKISGRDGSSSGQEDILREAAYILGHVEHSLPEQVIGPSGGFTPNNFFHVTKMQSLRYKVAMQRKKFEAHQIIANRSLSNPKKSTHMIVPQEAQRRVIQVGETVLRSSEITLMKDESKPTINGRKTNKVLPHKNYVPENISTQRRLTVHKTSSSPGVDDELASLSHLKNPALDDKVPDTAQTVDSIDAASGSQSLLQRVQRPCVKTKITLTPPNSDRALGGECSTSEQVVLEITTRKKSIENGEMSPDELLQASRATRSPETVMRQVYEKMNTKHSVTKLIDQIYHDDRKFMSKADKDNYLNFRSPIFELKKVHNLRTSEYFEDPPETSGRYKSPEIAVKSRSPTFHNGIDKRVIDPLALLRVGKIVRLGSPPLLKEGAVVGNEMPREESPANWYNQKRQLLKSHEKKRRDMSPEEQTHQMHLTQAGKACPSSNRMSDTASGDDPVYHGVLDAALKFGVLPVLHAGDTSPFSISRKAESSFISSPELDKDAENLLRMMPATIHEVNDDSIMHNSGELECRASTQKAHRNNT